MTSEIRRASTRHRGAASRAIPLVALLAGGCYWPSERPLRVERADRTIPLCERTVVATTGDSTALGRPAGCSRSVELTYLGVGGFVLRSDSFALMTAPSFTNPGVIRTLPAIGRLFSMSSRPDVVDRQVRSGELRGVSSLLVGHGHYDHLMDVPYVQRKYLPTGTVYGSRTAINLLAGDPWVRTYGRTAAVDDSAGGQGVPGRWIYTGDRRFRFMPLHVRHAPNWNLGTSRRGAVTIGRGAEPAPRDALPRRAREWKLGAAYAYLIDVLAADGVTPVFRVLYQDAAAPRAYNRLPAGLDRDDVDVAIICVGNHGNVAEYPESVLRHAKPRYVVLGHWENFFHPASAAPGVVPFTDTKGLERVLDARVKDRWATPAPHTTLTFAY